MAATTKTFTYVVLDPNGQQKKGSMSGPNQAAVSEKLIELGYRPVSLEEKKASLAQTEINLGFLQRVGLKDLSVFCRQFATMINSGLPIVRALNIMSAQTTNPKLRDVLNDVGADVRGGQTLSQAMGKHKEFPPLFVSMTQAGEVAGQLDEVLLRVADTMEKELALKRKVTGAMTYPIVVLVLSILLTGAMLIFVVPQFQSLFDMVGGQLPLLTRMMVAASDVLRTKGIWVILVLVILGFIHSKVRKTDRYREIVSPIFLSIPVFGPLLQKVAIARFSRNFGSLLRAGVAVVTALDITKETLGQPVIEDALEPVIQAVREGESVSSRLVGNQWFPQMMVQMMAVGEETGNSDIMLEKVADYYDEEVDTIADNMASALEPLMIVVLGGIVGTMVVGMYLPMFTLMNQLQG
ncbi:type II secretion system F family protein [Stomatohabitans albus]|uniref:type II secretion system F family protein n=1 Tax=Stomatohabitans albus TaxID=3110766 RepID=UPI00300C83FC